MRDLGKLGEDTFSMWCAHEGLICNPSHVDRKGWDFFVEFPRSSSLDPTQTHLPSIECKVQVKATDKKRRKWALKLSNLISLATTPNPAFIIFLEFDDKPRPQRAFLVHVGNELITAVIRRVYELEQAQNRADLHNIEVTVKYSDTESIELIDGTPKSLSEAIAGYVGSNLPSYIEKKKRHLAMTGHEHGSAIVTIQTVGEDNLRKLVDVSIGAEPSVTIQRFESHPTRFGMVSKNPTLVATGLLEMPDIPPTLTGAVRFRAPSLREDIIVAAKLFVSPFNARLPPRLQKLRFASTFFDITLSPFLGTSEISISLSTLSAPIHELRDAVRLMELTFSSGDKADVAFMSPGQAPITFSLNCRKEPFELESLRDSFTDAVSLLHFLRYSQEVISSVSEVRRSAELINQFYKMIATDSAFFRVEMDLVPAESDNVGFNPAMPVTFLIYLAMRIGGHRIGTWLAIYGLGSICGQKYTLESTKYNALGTFVLPPGDFLSQEELEARADWWKRSLPDQVIEISAGKTQRFRVSSAQTVEGT